MAIERVIEYFKALGADDKIITFDISSATVALAAEAVGCAPSRIAKTLSFLVDGAPVLIVTAGDMKIDNSKFKATFHVKAKMLTPDEVENLVGHKVGGVCPFAVYDGCKIYLDDSLKRFDTVYPAAGNDRSAVKLTIPELESYSNYISYVDVCKTVELQS